MDVVVQLDVDAYVDVDVDIRNLFLAFFMLSEVCIVPASAASSPDYLSEGWC